MRFEEAVVINRAVDEVWAYSTDFFNAPRMRGGNVLGLRQTSPRPPGGATRRAHQSALPDLKRMLETSFR